MRVFAARAAWLCALALASAAPVASDGHWTVGEWSECSRACDGGTRYREVTCADADGCGASPPVDAEACNWHACPTYAWSAGSWGECDATCGFAGERRRLVQCRAVAPSDDFATLGDVLEMRNALGDATWIGATAGITSAGLLGVVFGDAVARRVPPRVVRLGAAALFLVIGAVVLVVELG